TRQRIFLDPRKPHGSPRTAFTIAHELAHALYERSVGIPAASQSDYWRLEHICNHVAARLLLPDRSWDGIQSDGSPQSILIVSAKVASRYGVSRDVALRRALDVFANVEVGGAAEVRNHPTKGLIGRIS